MADVSNPTTQEMKPSQINLTLIVAATSKGGIGKNGALPWSLKAEMKYFARVTTRVPTSPTPVSNVVDSTTANGSSTSSSNGTGTSNTSGDRINDTSSSPQRRNAVIMGRRTWESIPARFRPLKGRINVVLSRSGNVQGLDSPASSSSTGRQDVKGELVLLSKGLEEGVRDLVNAVGWEGLGRAYVIGGGSVYAEALRLEQTRHVLLTRVGGEFECDTFFPLDLDGEDGRGAGWRRESTERLAEFTGEEFGSGGNGVTQREGDVEFDYCLYSR